MGRGYRARQFWAMVGGIVVGFLAAVAWEARSDAETAKGSLAVRYARAQVALAEVNLKRVSRLSLELGRSLVNQPQQQQREWETMYLLDEVQFVKERLLRNPPPGRVYPFWWY